MEHDMAVALFSFLFGLFLGAAMVNVLAGEFSLSFGLLGPMAAALVGLWVFRQRKAK